MLKPLALSAALSLGPLTASAVTTFNAVGEDDAQLLFFQSSNPQMLIVSETYEATVPLTLQFSVAVSSSVSADVQGLSFSVENGESFSVDLPANPGFFALGFDQLPSIALFPGEEVVVTLSDDMSSGTGFLGFSVRTTPIPLPAAGWMFVSALAGMGFVARRRRSP